MAAWRWVWLAVLVVNAGRSSAISNKRERRQASGSCVDSVGQQGTCAPILSCPALARLLQEARRRGGLPARVAIRRLRQETSRCPFVQGSPRVCCGSGATVTAARPVTPPSGQSFVSPTRGTAARPLVFGDSSRPTQQQFTQRPTQQPTQQFTQQFTQRPTQQFTQRPTQRPAQLQFTQRPTQRPTQQFTQQFTQRPQTAAPSVDTLSSSSRQSALPGEELCGRRIFSSRVFLGTNAEIGSWPWAASMGYTGDGGQLGWLCGATLISDRYVVTAAHCFPQTGAVSPVMVRLGELDFNSNPDCLSSDPTRCAEPHQDVPIAGYQVHPGYQGRDNNVFADDIALVRLARSVRFSEFVRPICLPADLSQFREGSDAAAGQKVFVVGWGRSSYESADVFTPILQEATLRLLPASDCERDFRRAGLRSLGSRLCATGEQTGADTCSGDSGGPLMVPNRYGTNWYLTGIVSFGPSTCGTRQAVYTRVHSYLDWIRDNAI